MEQKAWYRPAPSEDYNASTRIPSGPFLPTTRLQKHGDKAGSEVDRKWATDLLMESGPMRWPKELDLRFRGFDPLPAWFLRSGNAEPKPL